ncbi:MAG TPA: ribose 5-phosphate isomerase B [Paludibacter sp.]|nr:ribose 5-phosphate isomerase B [Paludibacter sp.]
MNPINEQRIAICSDHAGFELKQIIVEYLKSKEVIEIKDFGTYSAESCDYADFAHPMASAVENNEFDYGISICGSGNGISMTVNKHQGIRAALCWNTEIVALARQHNNANVLSLPARFISVEQAKDMVDVFFSTDFEGGRHQSRIDKIPQC